MKYIKNILVILVAWAICPGNLYAQMHNPVKWDYEVDESKIQEGIAVLRFKASLEDGWHIYSQNIEKGGPVPTNFRFKESTQFKLQGKVKEKSKAVTKFEDLFGMEISYFDGEALFEQEIKLLGNQVKVEGFVEFMVCNDENCLPPNQVSYSFDLKMPQEAAVGVESSPKHEEDPDHSEKLSEPIENTQELDSSSVFVADAETIVESQTLSNDESKKDAKRSLLSILIAGFLGGLAALLMPCIFPMLPLTVSYFTKSNDKGSAVGKALIYGASIVVIYVLLGLAITVVFGADALNALSTNGVFNFFFFLLLVVFAASFFGAFELTLPHSWGNKLDQKSDKSGLAGLFFMAATLAIVSFSCTGPIIGTLLVQAASMGEYLGPAVGMLGFSVALAAPFALFALFPSWLQSLPKSGGWLNSVKVVLGFLELALALKFLSNVDLAYHWDWFDREVFLVLWISIFGLLGMYLLGKIRFAHDSPVEYVSTPRIFLGIIVVAFTIYMVPGLWGAPLKSISAFLPPQHTQDFDLYTPTVGGIPAGQAHSGTSGPQRKYAGLFHAPLNLEPFFDYEEGMEYARQVGKPVLIDFTGHACVNCRKMEASIWPDPQVLKLIRDEYVLIQLYVDDKTSLPEEEHYVSAFSGKKINSIGKKWSDVQAQKFNSNSQPYYVLMDPKGKKVLVDPVGAIYDVGGYRDYLQSGIANFSNV
ncbi:cytochrome c biogenesis protein CcdA [Belliella marina]|uniref:Cytochrome c biogenesis protein CcdA n=1 Tax=Belliella marina TaxID=1644146 RepID=A0ABW4VNK3_9BACT